jgi:hypothetical protein
VIRGACVYLATVDLFVARTVAYMMFAGLFAILALRPRNSPAIWELTFSHKLAVVLFAATRRKGTITTAFDMTALNDLDRLLQTGSKGISLRRQLQDKLIEHKQYIDRYGQDMP